MTFKLETAIVRIVDSNGTTVGTGFILTDDGLIATCAHVVESAGAGPGDSVALIFHQTGSEATATVEPVGWREPAAEDVAILRLQSKLPAGVEAVILGPNDTTTERAFRAFGYPEMGTVPGVWAEGKILGSVTDSQGTMLLQLDSPQVAQGMSGGPVLGIKGDRVVGMVTATYLPDQTLKFRDTAFATPTEVLGQIWPALPISAPAATPANAPTTIGGINLSEIIHSDVTIGELKSEVTAGGDIVGGDKVTHNYYYNEAPRAKAKPRLSFEPKMVLIPAGPFTMGTDEGLPYEKPVHTVTLPDYRIGLYPITNRQFAAFIEATGKVVPSLGWLGQRPAPEQDMLPVTGVTWYLALDYCEWLSQATGRTYALPTEAEWEKAACGPDGRRYPWGDSWQEERANNDPAQRTAVDHFPAQSIYGCYDLVGNAREWTCSLWGSQPRQPETRFAYPPNSNQIIQIWRLDSARHNLNANSQVRRIYRGGTAPTVEQLRCTLRRFNMPDTKLDLSYHGLRVVRRIDDE